MNFLKVHPRNGLGGRNSGQRRKPIENAPKISTGKKTVTRKLFPTQITNGRNSVGKGRIPEVIRTWERYILIVFDELPKYI